MKAGGIAIKIPGLTAIVVLAGMALPGYLAAAESAQADSAQQALQQLKILQQRLGPQNQNSPANQENPANPAVGAGNARPVGTLPPPGAPGTVVVVAKPPARVVRPELPQVSDTEIIDQRAFAGVTRQMFPLTPEQILRLRRMYNTSEFAIASTAGTPPEAAPPSGASSSPGFSSPRTTGTTRVPCN